MRKRTWKTIDTRHHFSLHRGNCPNCGVGRFGNCLPSYCRSPHSSPPPLSPPPYSGRCQTRRHGLGEYKLGRLPLPGRAMVRQHRGRRIHAGVAGDQGWVQGDGKRAVMSLVKSLSVSSSFDVAERNRSLGLERRILIYLQLLCQFLQKMSRVNSDDPEINARSQSPPVSTGFSLCHSAWLRR